MQFPRLKAVVVVSAAALVAAGCGGGESNVTADERIEGCLQKQPDATEEDCKEWEEDGQLADDGTHQGHQSE